MKTILALAFLALAIWARYRFEYDSASRVTRMEIHERLR
jgi:YD repeat-containing protein